MMQKNKILIQQSSNEIELFDSKNSVSSADFNKCFINILLIYQNNKYTAVLICADIIWFSKSIVHSVQKFIRKKIHINKENIVFSASHTHGTPNPETSILKPEYSKNFERRLKNNIKLTFNKAIYVKKIKVEIFYQRTKATGISINRRKEALKFSPTLSYEMQNLPNANAKTDDNLDLLDFVNIKNKKVECSIVKFSCHPVSSIAGKKGSDYVGYLKKRLKRKTANVYFLQGFCGDIRPKSIKKNLKLKDKVIKLLIGDRFRKAEQGDDKKIGLFLANKIININEKKSKRINGTVNFASHNYKIKLENNLYLQKELSITTWNWSNVIFIFLNAEVLSGYNIENFKNKNVICVGYSNGMIGYLPTEKDINAGGYEVDKSRKNFQIDSRISLESEKFIKEKIVDTLKKLLSYEKEI